MGGGIQGGDDTFISSVTLLQGVFLVQESNYYETVSLTVPNTVIIIIKSTDVQNLFTKEIRI